MRRLRHQAGLSWGLKATAIAAFAGYCAWNVFWLSRGRLPPSLWSHCTGLPCPSSGLVRSLGSLSAGRFGDFVLYNPFTVAFVALFVASLLCLAGSWRKDRSPRLPDAVGRLWLITLAAAWAAKFLVGRQYW